MRVSSLLIALSFTYLASSIASEAAVVGRGASNTGSGTAVFVTVPYTVGGQTLFSSSIINVNTASVNNQNYLSGNNAGPAPQGGTGSKQGGIGVGRLTGGLNTGFGKGASSLSGSNTGSDSNANNTSLSNNTSNFSNTSSTGVQSSTASQFGSSSVGSSSLNINNGVSSSGLSSANITNGSSSAGTTSLNNGNNSFNNSSGMSSSGYNSSNTPFVNSQTTTTLNSFNNPGSTKPVLLISSLVDSTNPVFGSAGAFFQGVQGTNINTITFQYGSLPTASNQTSATLNQTPYLVVEDQVGGTANSARFLPVSAGTISRPQNNLGLTTVSFNSTQLQLRGQVQRVGIAFFRKGSVIIDNVTINGSLSTGIIAQASDVYPF